MILRDPVHGLVAFEGRAGHAIESLLGAREVQRLRRVRQLGLTSLVFPGAEHSRFAHALGTAHVMVRLQERIRASQDDLAIEEWLDDEAALDGVAAALLHDLGHGPFSHLFEDVLPGGRSHESWTASILRDPGTDVHGLLETLSAGMAERVASLLEGSYRLDYLSRAVSGTFDVDRADYLLRDSLMTGARYGLYDLDWLLRSLTFARIDDAPATPVLAIEGRKGLPPVEGFFLGRNFMYQQVYHHKATRAAEALVRAIFIRLAELVRDGSAPSPMPPALRAAAIGEPVSMGSYLDLDDARLMACLAEWEGCADAILADLCARLRYRRLPKTIPLPVGQPAIWEEVRGRVEEIVRAHGMRPDLCVCIDVPSDIPYEEPAGISARGLWVSIRHRPTQRLGDASFLLGELRNKRIERPRLVFPADVRDEVLSGIEGVLG